MDVPSPHIQEEILNAVQLVPQEPARDLTERMVEQILDIPVHQIQGQNVDDVQLIPQEHVPDNH